MAKGQGWQLLSMFLRPNRQFAVCRGICLPPLNPNVATGVTILVVKGVAVGQANFQAFRQPLDRDVFHLSRPTG